MLTETPRTIPLLDRDRRPAAGDANDPRDLPSFAASAADEARADRIERALDAVEALGRRRRAHELVEAVERLGAGLDTTTVALDDAATTLVDVHRTAPRVPVGPEVAVAAGTLAPVPAPAVPFPVPVVAAAAIAPATAPARPRRAAPAGLAAHVIDFPAFAG